MNVSQDQIRRCVQWIHSLDAEALSYLQRLLQSDEGDPTGVGAKLPTIPPDRESGIALETPIEWSFDVGTGGTDA